MKKYLWKLYFDCGRQGAIEGLFTATQEEIDGLMGREVYFGEALGKHSDIQGEIEECDISKVDLDSETVEKVEAILGSTWSGYNPFQYLSECFE